MSFPEQLKKARSNMNYTQQQVADLMGITKSTYCGYETGKRQPDVEKIKLLAKILHTSGDSLLETGFDTEAEEGFEVSDAKKSLIAEIEKMSESELDVVKAFIDSLDRYKKSFGSPDKE